MQRSIFALVLVAGLFTASLLTSSAANAASEPASPAPAAPAASVTAPLPTWLADAPAQAAPAIGVPQPTPMAVLCVQPPTTFCQSAACACQAHGGQCLCGGVLAGCNEATHLFSCLCRQC